jgi:hypothetical protein
VTPREPPRFTDRWLRFDPQRPSRARLLKRFAVAIIAMLILCALLAIFAGASPRVHDD